MLLVMTNDEHYPEKVAYTISSRKIMNNYKVGQIIYVILRKEAIVYPMQVVEEITKRNLDGEMITYMVKVGNDSSKVVAIDDIDGELFDNSDAARTSLIERVTLSITQRIEQAIAKAKEWYPSGYHVASTDPIAVIKKQTMQSKPVIRQETAELAAELTNETTTIELADGTKAKIKSIKLPDTLT